MGTYTIDKVASAWWDIDQQKMFANVEYHLSGLGGGSGSTTVEVTLDATTKTAIINALLSLISSG